MEAVVAPIVVPITGHWDGFDGLWSTFEIDVGTPPQKLKGLPATTSPGVTVPVPEGCFGPLSDLQDCDSLRGLYYRNESKTWALTGIYDLNLVGQQVSGLYGHDSIRFSTTNTAAANQTVIGVSQKSPWLSTLGLGNTALRFDSLTADSFLTSLKRQGLIPSVSYAYTAGQQYAMRFGSLILGGFDRSLVSQNAISIDSALRIDMQSIFLSLGNVTRGFLTASVSETIDSSVTELWLPDTMCDELSDSLKLTEDTQTGYFLLNETSRQALAVSRPSLILNLGGDKFGGTTSITLGYDALNLTVGVPVYNYSVSYFPIRRARDSIIFGRVILQEAYLVVDWERSNFTIGPIAMLNTSLQPQIIAIPAVTSLAASNNPGSAPQYWIVAAILTPILVLLSAGALVVLVWRRRKGAVLIVNEPHCEKVVTDSPDTEKSSTLYYDARMYNDKTELSALTCTERLELSSVEIVELPATTRKDDKPVLSCVTESDAELP